LQSQLEEQGQFLSATMQAVRQVQSQVTGMRNELIDVFRGQGAGLEEAMALSGEFKFSRKAFDKEECTLIRRYNGSSFAKPHPGGLLGCRVECLNEENCNAFNVDLKFGITTPIASCDLLECPPGASKIDMFEHISFERVSGKQPREQRLRMKKNKRSQGGLRRLE